MVLLGSVNPIVDTVFNGSIRYMGIKVGTDGEIFPRTALVSLPFSFWSSKSDSAQSSETALFSDSTGAITDGGIDLVDIGQNGATNNQILKWNGSAWTVADDIAGGSGWNWSDSSSRGPDSVLYADTGSYALAAGSATTADSAATASSATMSDSTASITDGGIDLSDIGQNGATNGQILKWNGSAWTVGSDNGSGTGWSFSGNLMNLTDSDDSVGIGTSTPKAKLDVSITSSGDTTIALRGKAIGGTRNYGLLGVAGDTSGLGYNVGVYALADNGDEAIGLYAKATGSNKVAAALLDGYVAVMGGLFVSGDITNDAGALTDGSVLFDDIGSNSATSGQVMKYSGSSWVAADDDQGSEWNWSDSSSYGPDSVLYADNSSYATTSDSTSAITDGGVDLADIGQNGATTDQILKWNGAAWAVADDDGVSVEVGAGLAKDTTGGIITLSIPNQGIVTSMYGSQSINNSHILPETITGYHINDNSITGADLADNTVSTADIDFGAVTTNEIEDRTIVDDDISLAANIHRAKIEGTAMTLSDIQVVSASKRFESSVSIGTSAIGGHQLYVTSDKSPGIGNSTAKIVNTSPDGIAMEVENASPVYLTAIFENLDTGPIMRCTNANGSVPSVNGGGIKVRAFSTSYAAEFYGNVALMSNDGSGRLLVELGEGLDYAEGFDVSENKSIGPGSVLIIDPGSPGELCLSSESYDTKVAGIVAGANSLTSGVRLGAGGFDHDVALAGRVYCNVDASFGEIQPGDLLTTSPTPGHAMVVKDHNKAQGAILGKAMESLSYGKTGQILVLVTLQ